MTIQLVKFSKVHGLELEIEVNPEKRTEVFLVFRDGRELGRYNTATEVANFLMQCSLGIKNP